MYCCAVSICLMPSATAESLRLSVALSCLCACRAWGSHLRECPLHSGLQSPSGFDSYTFYLLLNGQALNFSPCRRRQRARASGSTTSVHLYLLITLVPSSTCVRCLITPPLQALSFYNSPALIHSGFTMKMCVEGLSLQYSICLVASLSRR